MQASNPKRREKTKIKEQFGVTGKRLRKIRKKARQQLRREGFRPA